MGLLTRAHARGVSLGDYLQEIVAREAGLPATDEFPPRKRFDNLSDLLFDSPFAGANLYEYKRPGGPGRRKRWLETTDRQSQHVSVITLAEIQKGIELQRLPSWTR